ncbi:ATP-binding protein [Helcobacillus sp. ACRRO]|uniref:ATP-binding protein n=1 Tax=Helcobacillus sp. ACRRO TaxID=2918202 RepID=UPI001EF4FCE8|nr:ATP-binding protein [Helcobacillus sp. ACRRO]MCG7428188.1 ATP-binding protein [Helcobacillus sp. ACRRO]
MRNPFKPTAGATPPLLVGRGEQLAVFSEAIENGPGDPNLLTLITGARGAGKTVMLTELGEVARLHGWVVIDETATPGFTDRIADEADVFADELSEPKKPRLAGASIAHLGGLTFHDSPKTEPSWRRRLTRLLTATATHGTGVLITIDEVQGASHEELRQLAADVQHLIREDQAIALVLAGLPRVVEDVLLKGDSSVSTFLRRAERVRLRDVPVEAVAESLTTTFAQTGRQISSHELQRAADATEGYPFMIQLVGYHLWRLADDAGHISSTAVDSGLDKARVRLGSLVHEPALADLSPVDRTFLVAMAQDDGPVAMKDVQTRMNRASSYTSVYRDRLLAAGVIRAPRQGFVEFELPYLRDYLRGHAASHLFE